MFSKKTLRTILIATLIVLLLAGGFIYYIYSSMLVKIRYENLRGIGMVLGMYASDYETLPAFDKWCDILVDEADCHPLRFTDYIDREEGVCGYALNESLEGTKFSELPDKAVLVFEAKGPWNLCGSAELAKQSKRKDIAVIFVDGFVDLVTIDEIDKLKWKP